MSVVPFALLPTKPLLSIPSFSSFPGFRMRGFLKVLEWRRRCFGRTVRVSVTTSRAGWREQQEEQQEEHEQQRQRWEQQREQRQWRPSEKTVRGLRNFKPPPPSLPISPKELASELPFQYWYSYADLPPGARKRILKPPLLNVREDTAATKRVVRSAPLTEDFTTPNRLARSSPVADGYTEPNAVVRNSPFTEFLPRRPRTPLTALGYSERFFTREFSPEEEAAMNTPLSKEEVKDLVFKCNGSSAQINLGWDGWTPNYIALVRSYWKRSQVCKIKCKGAVTLDMDFLCNMIQEATGGTIIERVGGTLYLFRGRNYEYWKDVKRPPPVYRRYVRPVRRPLPIPRHLTKDDVIAFRATAAKLPALCKPGKNGVYLGLLKRIRKAFLTKELVRINCQEFEAKNMRTLGAQLQALVPCVLISFEFEHILMWRGKDWVAPKPKSIQRDTIAPSQIDGIQKDGTSSQLEEIRKDEITSSHSDEIQEVRSTPDQLGVHDESTPSELEEFEDNGFAPSQLEEIQEDKIVPVQLDKILEDRISCSQPEEIWNEETEIDTDEQAEIDINEQTEIDTDEHTEIDTN